MIKNGKDMLNGTRIRLMVIEIATLKYGDLMWSFSRLELYWYEHLTSFGGL